MMSCSVIVSMLEFLSCLGVFGYYFSLSMESKSAASIICVLRNLAMVTIEPWMFFLRLGHKDIRIHTPML